MNKRQVVCLGTTADGRIGMCDNMTGTHKLHHGQVVSYRHPLSSMGQFSWTPEETIFWSSRHFLTNSKEVVAKIRGHGFLVLDDADEAAQWVKEGSVKSKDTNPMDSLEDIAHDELQWENHVGGCSCHCGNPPCSSCTHPGHPTSVEIRLDSLGINVTHDTAPEAEDKIMAQALNIEHRTYVNGGNLNDYTVDDLLQLVANEQAAIDKLVELKLAQESAAVTKLMAKHKANIVDLLKLADTKLED